MVGELSTNVYILCANDNLTDTCASSRNIPKNPLPWVEEMINAPSHTNFFENRATDYAKGALSGDWNDVWGKAA
jgi:ribonucleotide reductase beta subunit family protein with ferritin-like domain